MGSGFVLFHFFSNKSVMNAISGDISSAIKFLEDNDYVVNGPFPPSARFLSDEEGEALPSSEMYLYIGGVVTCMLTAALAAGLTMGLLSIDPLKLAIKQKCGTDQEKRMAAAILPILSQHHLLLVTLLLMNAAANEALPLFLDELVPSYVAIVLSVTIVLFFGEVRICMQGFGRAGTSGGKLEAQETRSGTESDF